MLLQSLKRKSISGSLLCPPAEGKILKQQQLPENIASSMWLGGMVSQGCCGPEEGPSVRYCTTSFLHRKQDELSVFWMLASQAVYSCVVSSLPHSAYALGIKKGSTVYFLVISVIL